MKYSIAYILLSLVLSGCDRTLSWGIFPETPVNLEFVNSSFDDTNSDLRVSSIFLNSELVFSTNRPNPNNTNDFNLILFTVGFNWDRKEDFLSVRDITPTHNIESIRFKSLKKLESSTNSHLNEKGPYSFFESPDNLALFFSRDVEGVYSIHVVTDKPVPALNAKSLPYLRILDQSSNEMYPCFYGREFKKGDVNGEGTPEKILFSSDRDGQFDIYEIDIPPGMTPLQFLADSSPKEVKKLMINTDSNDHMPFVLGDLLVFASDRPGGLGGFDLYCSKKTADGWSLPVNFGPGINSGYDEYRPIVSEAAMFQNNLMIFSSNRPGGKGGFDLYYVGIPK